MAAESVVQTSRLLGCMSSYKGAFAVCLLTTNYTCGGKLQHTKALVGEAVVSPTLTYYSEHRLLLKIVLTKT